HRIRAAMGNNPNPPKLGGDVEMDETYVGGKPRRKANQPGAQFKRGRGTRKVPVAVLVERNGEARAKVIADVTGETLRANVFENVERSATLYSDEFTPYKK